MTAEREREAREFDEVVADAILNLLDLRQQAKEMDPTRIVMFADYMADLMQELRASHAAVRARAIGDAIRCVSDERWQEHHPMCDRSGLAGCCGIAARNAGLTDALTRLRAMEGV